MSIEARGGRVYIPKELREKYGERFRLVDAGEQLILVPVPEDPLRELREEWSTVDKSVEELKDEGLEEALREAG